MNLSTSLTAGRRPDALMIPTALRRGARTVDRVVSIQQIAEPLLQVDRDGGEQAWIRQQPGDMLFITRSLADSLLFPRGDARTYRPRYVWQSYINGIQIGHLVDEAQTC